MRQLGGAEIQNGLDGPRGVAGSFVNANLMLRFCFSFGID